MTKPTTFKFTDRAVARLPACPSDAASKAKEYTDSVYPHVKAAVGKSVGGREPHRSFLYRGMLNGKKVAITIGSAAMGVDAARARALEIKLDLEQGIDPRVKAEPEPVPATMTFADFANGLYKEWAQENKESAKADFSKLKVHLLPRWGDRPLESITRRDVEQYLLDLSQRGKASGKAYKPATFNRHVSLISKLFTKAMEWDLLDTNPAKGIKRKKENNIKTTHLKADQMLALFNALDLDRNKVGVNALKLLALTGARTSEILNAQWPDYDEKAATLYIRRTKGGVGRFLRLNTLAIAIIDDMKQYKSGKYIFPGFRDPSKPYNNVKDLLARALSAAGLAHIVKGFTPHCLRHSYASLLATNGASLYQIQGLLGHATATVTQRYAHLCTDGLKTTNQMVADVLVSKQCQSAAEVVTL